MKPIDFLKAIGVALVILIINFIVAIVAVVIYRFLINPGHPADFYDAAAERVAKWPIHIASILLFLFAGYFFTRRNPARNGLLFAAIVAVIYVIIDAAMVKFQLNGEFILWMLANVVAALAGAYFATQRKPANSGGLS